jgi:hypothetical protein
MQQIQITEEQILLYNKRDEAQVVVTLKGLQSLVSRGASFSDLKKYTYTPAAAKYFKDLCFKSQ